MIRAMHEKHSDKTNLDPQSIKVASKANAANTERLERRSPPALPGLIKTWGAELGFSAVGISGVDVGKAASGLRQWLEHGRHGEMDYMAKHAELRAHPERLLADVRSAILVSLPYWPRAADAPRVLASPPTGYLSRYALGRDYHKTLRQRLQKLATRLSDHFAAHPTADGTPFTYRVFTDSAPVFEVELARQSGIAWRGKHTLSLSRQGSWHFLGGMYTSLALPPDTPQDAHCGTCRRCLDACPTKAIVAPYEVDARLCISYLTIELHGAIPAELRALIGNRIYGCDDCQLCCPWNRFARLGDPDFTVRHGLDAPPLVALFHWSAADFEERLAGSPIRRIGHERWLRNIAVALGNAPPTPESLAALAARQNDSSALVREHVAWALAQQGDIATGAAFSAAPTCGS